MNWKKILSWVFQVGAAAILLQTLYFKFTAQPESVELFTKLGVELWGRIGTGVIELIASVLLLTPAFRTIGATLGIGLMGGAIMSHLLVLGIESQGDGGQLFILAISVMICCVLVLILNKSELFAFWHKLIKK